MEGVLIITRLRIGESTVRIGTSNIRNLYGAGKSENFVQETKRLKLSTMGISELRWPGSGTRTDKGGLLYYSGSDNDDPQHRNGVGIFVTSEIEKYVLNFAPINDKIILLQ